MECYSAWRVFVVCSLISTLDDSYHDFLCKTPFCLTGTIPTCIVLWFHYDLFNIPQLKEADVIHFKSEIQANAG